MTDELSIPSPGESLLIRSEAKVALVARGRREATLLSIASASRVTLVARRRQQAALLLAGSEVSRIDVEELPLLYVRQRADAGDSIAQTELGRRYYSGCGVPKDPIAASSWYEKAVAQGDLEAASALGDMYRRGEGVPQDLAKAVLYYSAATNESVMGDWDPDFIAGMWH